MERVAVIDDFHRAFAPMDSVRHLCEVADVTIYEQEFPTQDALVDALRLKLGRDEIHLTQQQTALLLFLAGSAVAAPVAEVAAECAGTGMEPTADARSYRIVRVSASDSRPHVCQTGT